MDEPRKEIIVSLAEALREPHPGKREEVLAKLKEAYVRDEGEDFTTDPEVARMVLPYATRALEDVNAEARISGIQAIELFAPDAAHLIPALVRMLSDAAAEVRVAALEALGEFGPRASEAAPEVEELRARARTAEERSAAENTLYNLGAARGDSER